jgi:hypothetical protein
MKSTITQLIAGMVLLGVGMVCHAEIYRCVDEAGNVIFTQHRCGPAQQGEAINLDNVDVNLKPKPEVCKQVEKLAELVFPHIHETDSILDVYSQLGGREYLSAGITAAVNYVFNFRFNPKARQTEVVALTHAKCLDGGFGQIKDKDLPDWDKIKYKPEKPRETGRAQPADLAKTCHEYDEKLTQLRQRLKSAKDKSEKMQARVDMEYVEEQIRQQCQRQQKPERK